MCYGNVCCDVRYVNFVREDAILFGDCIPVFRPMSKMCVCSELIKGIHFQDYNHYASFDKLYWISCSLLLCAVVVGNHCALQPDSSGPL